ncbi:MAG: pilus assembly protein TadB [Burkholderiales bacterium]|jgi:tight adherence protein B|nr:MAG: pilus assembly protein TadB [Burkholderiales bacterium]
MDWAFAIFLLVCFLAVVLLLEGGFLLWNDTRGAEVRQLERRLRALQAGGRGTQAASLVKAREADTVGLLGKLLLRLPRVSMLERSLQQAGVTMPTSRFLMTTGLLTIAVVLVALALRQPLWLALVLGVGSALLPFAGLSIARTKRLNRFQAQLPDAVELIARALRAGHAFPPALQMVSEELPDPIGGEFATAFEEVNYGIPVSDAMQNLATRVPVDDLRFFAVAVILQRETGGNLAEILDNISRLIRERFKLLGTIRVLSAEGKLSAWILTLLPFATALMINLVSPGFMDVLWKDPIGYRLIFVALFSMAVGVFWMWRIIKIRV